MKGRGDGDAKIAKKREAAKDMLVGPENERTPLKISKWGLERDLKGITRFQ